MSLPRLVIVLSTVSLLNDAASEMITPLPAIHTVPAVGYHLESGTGSLVFSGDTGPNDELWEIVNRISDLKVLIVETAFSNKERQLAEISKHLCPSMLADELAKLQDRVPPFPSDQAIALVERALGARIDALFASFESEPVAAGMLAQPPLLGALGTVVTLSGADPAVFGEGASLHAALQAHRTVHCAFVFDTEILDALPSRVDRRVEFVERLLHDPRRHLGRQTSAAPAFFHDHRPVGLLEGLDHRVHIQRAQRAQVDDLGLDAQASDCPAGNSLQLPTVGASGTKDLDGEHNDLHDE